MAEKGKLYLCGTPIGNLADLSQRALQILENVNLIAAEDTRRTSKLLNYYQIKTPLISYHEHNERDRALELVTALKTGKEIALVSDAGMPGISDPGEILVKEAIKAGIEVIPIPGPTAAIAALVVSGLTTRRFVFEGFLPRREKERKKLLQQLKDELRTIVIYEAPHRLLKTLQDIKEILGPEREMALIRELTKVHEEKIYGNVRDVLEKVSSRDLKGEFVLVISGQKSQNLEVEGWEELSILEHLQLLISRGFSKKKAIKEVAKIRGLPKSRVYQEAVVIDYLDQS